jgi:glutamate N-acetyltransferase / amino-acid N-acetyltransferase
MEPIVVEENSPGISDVPGFTAAGVGCDIRNKNDSARLDVALLFSEKPCTAAGVFTINAVKAAPVRYCQEVLQAGGPFHGIVANSGNANACTGDGGMADAREMARLAAEGLGVSSAGLFVCSTGRIGERLPMEKLARGIRRAVEERASSPEQGQRSASAILTSDTRSKTITVRCDIDGKSVTVSGIAKGAGMIQPNMATMLAFLATDAAVEQAFLQEVLAEAVRQTFNRITVDGDMSTNDTVLILANGASGATVSARAEEASRAFRKAVWKVCDYLADKIVSDGEKISKVVEVLVDGAASEEEAEKVARAVGNSLLVKSSWYGEDPNWGRLADAAGYSGASFDDRRLDIFYGDIPAVLAGEPVHANKPQWKEYVRNRRFSITIRLNVTGGEGSFRLLATDLTESYVHFNKSE